MIKNKNSITIATAFIGILLTTIAFNACEDREYNNPYDEKVEIDTLAPYDLQVEQTGIFERKLTWKCDAEKVEKFIIDKKVGDGNWQDTFAEVSGDTYERTDTEIELNKTYQYRVKAKFDANTTPEASVEFDANIPSPTDLQTEEISDVSYKLLWKDNSNGEQGFRIDRKRNNHDWEIDYREVQANQTQFVDTNVFASRENNINVEYRVYAFYDQYESEKISTNTNAALTAPTNLQIISNSISSVTLSWQDNSEGEQGFRIERKYEGGSWNEINETQSNSFEDTDFELNTQVYYRVSSYYNQYSSSYLESDFDATIPAPENFEITQNSMTSVTLNWSYPYTGHDDFQIDRKVDNGSWETEYQTVDAATTSLTDEVDLENHNYSYRITAILDDYQSVSVDQEITNYYYTDPRDGQRYQTVEIGNQVWFAENLNYETYNSWWYDNDPENGETYGRLYTWDAALNACPDGWHLPSDEEWKTLEMELGMSQSEADDDGWRGTEQGEHMKSTSGWNNDGNGTNSSGFSALPGGYKVSGGPFVNLGSKGYWWSSTEFSSSDAWNRSIHYDSDDVRRYYSYKDAGFSVRCLKD